MIALTPLTQALARIKANMSNAAPHPAVEALRELNACNWLDVDPFDSPELDAAKAKARKVLEVSQ